jgi:predicted PurR-regulated permease PerM
VLLAVTIVGMFVITYASGNSMNIYNYEQQVIDKYEAWEQELDEREADLTKREQILQNQTGQ